MSTFTSTSTETFSLTHAKYLASKIATDLQRCSDIYGAPSAAHLKEYEEEITLLLKAGYLKDYEFGYKRNGCRVVCWKYSVRYGELSGGDDRPGKIYRKSDVEGAEYYNFLSYSDKWNSASDAERESFRNASPIRRSDGSLPADGSGSWVTDKTYASGAGQVSRQTYIS